MKLARIASISAVCVMIGGIAQAANLLDTMRQNPSLSTFVGLINKAGLQTQFTGTQPLTVLAPTNGAFDDVGASQLRAIESSPEQTRTFVLSHVIAGTRIWGGGGTEHTTTSVRTLAGTELEIETTDAGGATINNRSRAVSTNIRADNGVIHTISLPIGAR